MTKKQLQKSWERNKFEIHCQKPKIGGRYPKEVEQLRGLLIIAQVILGKTIDHPHDEWLLEMSYHGLMKIYEERKKKLAAYF